MEGDDKISPSDPSRAKAMELEGQSLPAAPSMAVSSTDDPASGAAVPVEDAPDAVGTGLWYDDTVKPMPPAAEVLAGEVVDFAETDLSPAVPIRAAEPVLMDAGERGERDVSQSLAGLKPPAVPLLAQLSEFSVDDLLVPGTVADRRREFEGLITQVVAELTPGTGGDRQTVAAADFGRLDGFAGENVVETATAAVIYNAAMIPGWPFPSAFAKDDYLGTAKPLAEVSMTPEEMAEYLAQIGARLRQLQNLRERIAEVGGALVDRRGFLAGLLKALDSTLEGLKASLKLGQQQLALIPATGGGATERHRFRL